MIYIYGGGGRAKLIKEILIRHEVKSKEIKFIDDYIKGYKRTSYLLKNFNKKKDQLYIGISDPKLQQKKYSFFKKNFKKLKKFLLLDLKVLLKLKIK